MIILPIDNKKILTDNDKNTITHITDKLHLLTSEQLCLLSICALKAVIPIWNKEVKQRHIVYADRVCGMVHRIDKCVIEQYLFFLENNHKEWNNPKITKNEDILELWVAATDLDFVLSRKGFFILMAVFSLMHNLTNKNNKEGYFELFANLSQVFETVDEFGVFFAEVVQAISSDLKTPDSNQDFGENSATGRNDTNELKEPPLSEEENE
jgi:hypothetical protein